MNDSNRPANPGNKPGGGGSISGNDTTPAAAAAAVPVALAAAASFAPPAAPAPNNSNSNIVSGSGNVSAAVAAAAAVAGSKPSPSSLPGNSISIAVAKSNEMPPSTKTTIHSSPPSPSLGKFQGASMKPPPPSSLSMTSAAKEASAAAATLTATTINAVPAPKKIPTTKSNEQMKGISSTVSGTDRLFGIPSGGIMSNSSGSTTAKVSKEGDSKKAVGGNDNSSSSKIDKVDIFDPLPMDIDTSIKPKSTTSEKPATSKPVKPKPTVTEDKKMLPKKAVNSTDDLKPLPSTIQKKAHTMTTAVPSSSLPSKPQPSAATPTSDKHPSSITKPSATPITAATAITGSATKNKGENKPIKKMKKSKDKSSSLEAKPKKKKGSIISVDGPTMAEVLKKKGKKKKEKLPKDKATSGSNPNRKLPTAASKKKKEKASASTATGPGGTPSQKQKQPSTPSSSGYSAQQAAVNDMMRRALEEDQYSALGSVVDTDTDSDNDDDDEEGESSVRWNHRPKRGSGNNMAASTTSNSNVKPWMGTTKVDRQSIMMAMRKHLRIEGMKSVRNFDGSAFLEDAEDYMERGGGRGRTTNSMNGKRLSRSMSPRPLVGEDEEEEEILASDGRKIGKRRKKKKKGKSSSSLPTPSGDGTVGSAHSATESGASSSSGTDTPLSGSGNDDDWDENPGVDDSSVGGEEDDDVMIGEEEESSIFGQTAGASNATWVECDRCKKWRRLRGVVDARKLPSRWYCSMNKTDPDRARCSAPEEEYESATTPESAMDQRTRKHLRVWVRRLHCNEAFENRQRSSKKRAAALATNGGVNAKERPYEWIRCCNPSCGKWRMLLRSMDAGSVIDKCNKKGEWYCVMNTWDEKAASCGAAQENLPAVGCPPWVLVDDED